MSDIRAIIQANFLELRHGELLRIPLPRTPLNRGKKEGPKTLFFAPAS